MYSMTAGPDGALWFTGFVETSPGLTGYGVVGRITTSGNVTIYPDGSTGHPERHHGRDPTVALWFIEGSDTIGRITTSGSRYRLPHPTAQVLRTGGHHRRSRWRTVVHRQ